MNINVSNSTTPLKQKNDLFSTFTNGILSDFNPIVGKPYNIEKVTLEQVDNLQISYIFTTGRSASTLLGVMLMMNEQVVFTSEEIFPVILKQKYASVKKWNEKTIQEYCDDFVLMSEGKLYPLFTGKDVLYQLLIQFKEHLNYERVIRLSYLSFGVNKDLSKITTIVDKQLRYYLAHHYLNLFPKAKVLLLVRDPRDNVYSKYKRAERKKIKKDVCLYIQTWKEAFETYFKLLNNSSCPHLIINYENLINNSKQTMTTISDFLHISFTERYFQYPDIVNDFFSNIQRPKLKEHFLITHKSLQQPISPQKVNEWKNFWNDKKISKLINGTWYHTKDIAIKLNYQEHENYKHQKLSCFKSYLKVKMASILANLYFNYISFSLRKKIKQKKYPHRINAISAYDKFLRQGYL
ncbi:MAG: hypothetical protein KatS3mg027_1481 [Bacteroidia bacterium]|nr:MAG: hypothetical protein KatS3mg027_1481 [Bacteroidia bacterium]